MLAAGAGRTRACWTRPRTRWPALPSRGQRPRGVTAGAGLSSLDKHRDRDTRVDVSGSCQSGRQEGRCLTRDPWPVSSSVCGARGGDRRARPLSQWKATRQSCSAQNMASAPGGHAGWAAPRLARGGSSAAPGHPGRAPTGAPHATATGQCGDKAIHPDLLVSVPIRENAAETRTLDVTDTPAPKTRGKAPQENVRSQRAGGHR